MVLDIALPHSTFRLARISCCSRVVGGKFVTRKSPCLLHPPDSRCAPRCFTITRYYHKKKSCGSV